MIFIHLACSLASYVAFLIAFVSGLLFLMQHWQLKHKHMGLLFHRLPALGALERVNVWSIGLGFGLLSIGLSLGLLKARWLLGQWWRWDSKELFALALWSAYLGVVVARARAVGRGRKVAMLSVLGFTLVLLTFLGANRWLPSWHPKAVVALSGIR